MGRNATGRGPAVRRRARSAASLAHHDVDVGDAGAGMGMWEAIVLGLVQGLTEFLPISSSAHLRIVGELIGSADPGAAFTAITQIGTETAVLLYFRHDIATSAGRGGGPSPASTARDRAAAVRRARPGRADGLVHRPGQHPDRACSACCSQESIENTFRNLYLIAVHARSCSRCVLGWADRRRCEGAGAAPS